MMKVQIYKNPIGSIDVFFVEERHGKFFIAKPVQLEFEEVTDASVQLFGTFSVPFHAVNEFMVSMAEALDSQGVKTENDHKVVGLLEATRAHLDDMRKIVFTVEDKR
jgi:hypothetical protein